MFLRVHVLTESAEEGIRDVSGGTLAVAVREKAERGLANRRALQLLCAHFGAGKWVRIASGHHSPRKIISVD